MNKTLIFTASLLATMLIISSIPLYFYLNSPQVTGQDGLNQFSSYDDLKSYLEASSSSPSNYWFGRGGSLLESGDSSAQSPASAKTSDYSKTNIQVEGVDEADIVKTDG